MDNLQLTKSGQSYLSKLEEFTGKDSELEIDDFLMLKFFQLGGDLEDLSIKGSGLSSKHRKDIRRLFEAGYIEEVKEVR